MQIKKLQLLMLPLLIMAISCNSSIRFFSEKTAHEKYAEAIEKTDEGKQWIALSKTSLEKPYSIELPYRHAGYFPGTRPRALTLQFTAKRGEKITVDIDKKTDSNFMIYADLFEKNGLATAYIESLDSLPFSTDTDEKVTYLLRLQPELFQSGFYDLSISLSPSLDFPVAGNKAKTGSFWGDIRDGGKRRHEGIDIFAPKLTPAVAAADGYITGVQDGGIGGKTVWMRVANRNITLYYAHLDKQLVKAGQRVKMGDTLGLVGNSGNAKYTPSHLHFGVYTYSGPIDPWPFVNKKTGTADAVKPKELESYLQWKDPKSRPADDELLTPLAVTSKNYIAELADGSIISAPINNVKRVAKNKTILPSGEIQKTNTGG